LALELVRHGIEIELKQSWNWNEIGMELELALALALTLKIEVGVANGVANRDGAELVLRLDMELRLILGLE
jgi:hypothetical protein